MASLLAKILLSLLALPLVVLRRRRAAVAVVLFACFSSRPSEALTCTWKASGGTGGNSWSQVDKWTASGTGGGTACPPTDYDAAVFNTGSVACAIDVNADVASFSIASSYTGTITPAAGIRVSTTGNFSFANAATFTAGTGRMEIGNDFILSSGTFTAPSSLLSVGGAFNRTGGTFNHNGGTVMLASPSSKTFTSGNSTFTNLLVNDGLVGYWNLDESSGTVIADRSGFQNDGTLVNGPTWTTGSGNLPTVLASTDVAAVTFDGTNDYANLGVSKMGELDSHRTIAAWLYWASVPSVSANAVVLKSGASILQLGFNGSSNLIKVWKGGSNIVVAASSVPASGWHHVAYTFDGITNTLYIDGVSVGTSTTTLPTGSVDTALLGSYGGATQFWTGRIDDVRIYDRALTSAQVVALNAGGGPSAAVQTVGGNPIVLGDLRISSGTLAGGNTTMTVANNWVNYDGTFTTGTTGTVSFNGSVAGNTINNNGSAFNNLTIAGANGTASWQLADSPTVVGNDLAISQGILISTPGRLEIQGAFNKTGGTFTANGGQVMLSSTTGAESFVTGSATFNNLTINDGLLAYWTLDETASPSVDSSGYGRDATWNSTPSGSTPAPGITGFTNSHSLSIDTSADYASFSSPAAPIITVAGWIKATAAGGGAYQRILDMPGYVFFVNGAGQVAPSNPMALAFTSNRSSIGQWKSPSNSIVYGNWYHVAVTYDSSSTSNLPSFYINGALVATTTQSGGSGSATSNVGTGYIGNASTVDRYFNGVIDDLRVYNRALTSSEINSLAIGRQPGTFVTTHTMSGTPTISGDLVIASGKISGATSMTIGGNWLNYGGAFSASSGTVTFTSSGSVKILSAGSLFRNIGINATGTFTLADNLETDPSDVVSMTAVGTFDLSSYTLRTGDVDRAGAVTITPNTGRVVFDSDTNRILDTGTYYNLDIEPVGSTNLRGYWKLDETQGFTTHDYGYASHDGTLNSVVTSQPNWTTSTAPTEFYNPGALTFTGSDFVDVPSSVITTSSSFSACTWVNFSSLSGVQTMVSVDGATSVGATSVSNFFVQRQASGKFDFAMYGSDSSASTGYDCGGTSTTVANTWYHVCGVFNGTNLKLYVNGNLETTSVTMATPWAATGHAIIGAGKYNGVRNDFLNGTVDDVRMYDIALSATQVAALAAGRYPSGVAGLTTYTAGYGSTVSGTFKLHNGVFNSNTHTLNASAAGNVAYITGGTYTVGSAAQTFAGGLTVRAPGTLNLATSGGTVNIGSGKVLNMDGTLSASSTGATIQTAGGASTYYDFNVGTSATATPTLNITGLAVKNTTSNGMYINSVAGSSTTFTNFNNIAFSGGTGSYLLRIYATSLALYGDGLTFDASTTSNLKLAGNGTGDGETRTYFGATCTSTPCESYDADDDSEPDGTGDTGVLGDEAVAQWLHTAYDDTAGSIQGFPTTAFDWNTFTYWNTYVVYRDFSGTTDRLFARDTDGAFKTTAGGAGYYWDLPSSVGDIIGAPRWTTEVVMSVTTHYVYVLTTLGYVYKLSDSGTAFTLVATQAWPYRNGASATATSPLAMDNNNLYWAGNDGAGAKKMFSLTTAMVLNGTRTVVADVVASPALATVSAVDYLFTATNGKIYKTPTNVSSETTSTVSTSTVYGRVTVYGGVVYFPEDIGKIWALTASALSTSWSYQDTNVGRHASGCSANSSCTVRNLYYDPSLSRLYFGDKDGHVYVLTSAGAILNANYPYRPGASTDEFQTAPLYRSGMIVIGSVTGKVFIIDQNNGTGPAVNQTFNFGSAISTIAYDTDGYYVVGTADGKLYYLNAVTDPTAGSI